MTLHLHDLSGKEANMATTVQVIFYSMYGYVYRMAEVVAAGAHEVAGDSLNSITDSLRKRDDLQIMG
jgi:hypothetical protein